MLDDLYRRYLTALKTTTFDGRYMPYEWSDLPKRVTLEWWPYRDMFDEFSREIANSLNDLTNYTHRLKAWASAISSMTNQEKLEAIQEFIDPLATLSLNLPYVIRSRFIFAAAHLCHQANHSLERESWKDDLPLDRDIGFAEADKYGARWRTYTSLKRRLERIGDRRFQAATHDFRNSYNHRFSQRIGIGLTQFVTRRVEPATRAVSYAFGTTPALALDVVAGLLSEQCQHGYKAFEAFQSLIGEHTEHISAG